MKSVLKKQFNQQSHRSRKECYEFLVRQLGEKDSTHFLHLLEEREGLASIEIFPGVVMPHLESSRLVESQIIILQLKNGIQWLNVSTEVRLIVLLAVKKGEEREIKHQIVQFVHQLANEEFIQELLDN